MLETLSKKTPQLQIFACLKGTTVPFLITVYTCYFSSWCNLTTITLKWEELPSFFRGNRCSSHIKWHLLLLLTFCFITCSVSLVLTGWHIAAAPLPRQVVCHCSLTVSILFHWKYYSKQVSTTEFHFMPTGILPWVTLFTEISKVLQMFIYQVL